MVAIPDQENKTISAIYQHYEDTRTDWRRPHLGASLIGRKCPRMLYYTFRWCAAPAFPGRVLRLFDTGNHEEARIVKDLRDIGIEVYDKDPQTNEGQIRYADPECGGHFSGSLDGVGRGFTEAPKAWHVLEFKTSNAKGFAKLKKEGVEKAKPEHYAQMQCYMHWSGIERAYYFAVCKDTDQYYGERVRYDPIAAGLLTDKAKAIIFSDEPPKRISGNPECFDCRYCDYKSVCHEGQLPEINCRTCSHSTPVIMDMEGRWDCSRLHQFPDCEYQKDGCPQHIYNPALVPHDVIGADAEKGTITYDNGITNGPGGMSSRDMR